MKKGLIILFFLPLFSFSRSSGVMINDSTQKDQSKSQYALTDPRNPDCPCHKLQQKADDEYRKMKETEQRAHPLIKKQEPDEQLNLQNISPLQLNELAIHQPDDDQPLVLRSITSNSSSDGSGDYHLRLKKKKRSNNFVTRCRKKVDHIFSRQENYKSKQHRCFNW